MTPFLNSVGDDQNTDNEEQIKTRDAVARSFGVWKKRFSVLAIGINMNLESVERILVATAVFHNIAFYVGDESSKVTHQMEQLTYLSTFSIRSTANNSNNNIIQRNNLVRYFRSL